MARFDGFHQVVCCVVDPGNDICIAFGIRSPLDNNFVKSMGSLELPEAVSMSHFTGQMELTGCLCGVYLRVAWKPSNPQECCLHDLPDLQR